MSQPTETLPATNTPAASALELLQLPARDTLTDRQAGGRDCVWCSLTLTAETATDLGERTDDEGTRWFPRGCGQHTTHAALSALHDHAPECEQCVDNAANCATGLGLRRLMRAGRR